MDERTTRAVPARRPLLVAWAPVVGWAALIFVLSAQPDLRFVQDEGLDFVVRKLGHIRNSVNNHRRSTGFYAG